MIISMLNMKKNESIENSNNIILNDQIEIK